MTDKQIEGFNELVDVINELGLQNNIIFMGSWAEWLYAYHYSDESLADGLRTRDVDVLYTNINKPRNKIPLISRLAEVGFEYVEDVFTGVGKLVKEDCIEVEFIVKKLGSGAQDHLMIPSIGIKADSLRDVNNLDKHTIKIEKGGKEMLAPHPSVFVLQKIAINEHRVPEYKKPKDRESVNHVLPLIKKLPDGPETFRSAYQALTAKDKKSFWKTVFVYRIDVSGLDMDEEKEHYNNQQR